MRFDNENKIERNQYNIGSLSYPIGVGKDEDKQHFIQFFINVRGKSKFNNKESINGTQEILDKVDAGRKGQNGLVENDTDAIIIASYGTFSTGINIRNIHNIVFSSPSKSKIRVLQSIGRGLRQGKNKTSVLIFDIADDISYNNRENFTLQHFQERINIYNEEKFNYEISRIKLK